MAFTMFVNRAHAHWYLYRRPQVGGEGLASVR
jgi:hypothetical protein